MVIVEAAGAGSAAAEVSFIGLDKFTSIYSSGKPRAITTTLLGSSAPASFFVKLLSVDAVTGAQMGSSVDVNVPTGSGTPSPASRIMYSTQFYPGHVIVLGENLAMARLPITVQSSGTPVPGLWGSIPAFKTVAEIGNGRAIAEMAGSAFLDGKSRLFVGTDRGKVMVLMRSGSGSVGLDRVVDAAGGRAINDLGAVPRYGRIDLGVAADSAIYMLRAGDNTYLQTLRAGSPDGHPVDAFKVFNPTNQAFTLLTDKASAAFSDGITTQVHFVSIGAIVTGNTRMDTTSGNGGLTALDRSIAYVLSEPSTGNTDAFYRPGYTDGSSNLGCVVNITDAVADECTACPIAITGDVDQSGSIGPVDIILLVSYVFKGGASLDPCDAAGDADCSGHISAADVLRLVSYVYKGGPAPCNVCTLFASEWTCP